MVPMSRFTVRRRTSCVKPPGVRCRADDCARSATVKYMLIIYGNQELWSSIDPADLAAEIAEFDAFNKKHYDSGELLGSYGVADAAATRLVRLADGQPVVTDGPYLETKEYLASWWLIDVDSDERALAIAAEMPAAKYCPVEVWPILHEARSLPGAWPRCCAAIRRGGGARTPSTSRHRRPSLPGRTRASRKALDATTRSSCCSCAATPRLPRPHRWR
jgi:hypothetical protein